MTVLTDKIIKDALDLTGRQDRAVPDAQTFVTSNLYKVVDLIVDIELRLVLVGVSPAEFVDEQGPEVSGVY
ncbi:hypothetical protein A3852_20865 [Rhodococcus qingshengii]|nr:hypothetical protein A3852_20865 [Rhodococcus qingshengii]